MKNSICYCETRHFKRHHQKKDPIKLFCSKRSQWKNREKHCPERSREIFSFFFFFLVSFFFFPAQIQAIKVGEIPIGAVIQLGDYKFLKITSSGLFVTIDPYPKLTFQDFTSVQCNSLTTCNIGDNCNANGSTVTLTDARDDKTYRVRKFADGNCWMIDNLAYGGSTTDGCRGKSVFDGGWTSDTTGHSVYGTWTGSLGTSSESFYGDCRDPSVPPYCTLSDTCVDPDYCLANNCGYLYSWQAAMQASLAYWGSDYTDEPGNNGAGICPDNWIMSNGGNVSTNGSLNYLAKCTSGNCDSGNNPVIDFWIEKNYFDGLYTGGCNQTGSLYRQGWEGYIQAKTQSITVTPYANNRNSLYFVVTSSSNPTASDYKSHGLSVRCLFNP